MVYNILYSMHVYMYIHTYVVVLTIIVFLYIQQNSDNLLSLTELKEWVHNNVRMLLVCTH